MISAMGLVQMAARSTSFDERGLIKKGPGGSAAAAIYSEYPPIPIPIPFLLIFIHNTRKRAIKHRSPKLDSVFLT